MNYIDLHTHSTASDGTLSPADLIEYAHIKNLSAIALTDHDTVSGVSQALETGKNFSVKVIGGIEMSCLFHEKEIHILGYFVDPENQVFKKGLRFFTEKRNERNLEIIRRFENAGIHFTLDELRFGYPNTVITRAHFARLLMEKGYVSSVKQAFSRYLVYGGQFVPVKKDITPEMVLDLYKNSRVWGSLAHPLQYRFSDEELISLLKLLKNLGLRGLEVFHSSHHPGDTKKLTALADRFGLLPTGGTDFHGANKPDIDLGSGFSNMHIPLSILTDIEKDYKLM